MALVILCMATMLTHGQFRNRPGSKSGQNGELSFPLETIYTDIKSRTLRKVLSHLEFSAGSGAGVNRLTQNLVSLGLYQAAFKDPVLFSPAAASPATGVTNWSVDPKTVPLSITTGAGDFLVNTENQQLQYRGAGMVLPVEFMVSAKIKRIRIGIGSNISFFNVSELRSIEFPDQLRTIPYSSRTLNLRSIHLYAGYDIFRMQDWVITADAQAGKLSLSRAFDLSNLQSPVFLGAGATIRRELTEYLSLYARPSLGLSSFRYTPVTGTSGYIQQQMVSLTFSVGATIAIAELPKCFVKTCGVQMDHPHGNREYRSRVHPIYKRQNPGYGENYGHRIRPVGTRVKK